MLQRLHLFGEQGPGRLKAVSLGLALGLVVMVVYARIEPELVVFDVGADFAQMAQNRRFSDQSTAYFGNEQTTVHMHVMGMEQTCPLHLHRDSHEVTAIVVGTARVTQIFGSDGGLEKVEGAYPPGSVVASPPFCGHEWYNPDTEHMLGNLVFSRPSFDGNFYLHPTDPRLLKGGAPFHAQAQAALERLAHSGQSSLLEPLPVMDGHMAILALQGESTLAAVKGSQVIYTLAGEGVIQVGRRKLPLRETYLAVSAAEHAVRLQADSGHPLALLIFDPVGDDHPILGRAE
jgi:hypothetical protein